MSSREENLIKISSRLCYPDITLPLEECFFNRRKWFCNNSENCEINKLSNEQLEYIISDINNNSFLEACPGSGKTEVVGIKAAYEIAEWEETNSGIAILTFTKNAAKEIQNRVSKYTGSRAEFPHFIGTIDSWLHSFILHPFGYTVTRFKGKENDKSFRIIDSTSTSDFLNAFKTRYAIKQQHIQANFYNYDLDENKYIFSTNNFALTSSLNSFSLASWQKDDLTNTKNKFWRNGFCTYQDAEIIILNVLNNYPKICKLISNRFKQIVIDECQDLSIPQIYILSYLIENGSKMHFIGDINQSIYEFRKVDPHNTIDFIESNNFAKIQLSKNFRSNQQIVDICSKIIKPSFDVIGNEENNIDNPFKILFYAKENIQELPELYLNILKTESIEFSKSVILGRNKSLLCTIDPKFSNKLKRQHQLALALLYWNKTNKSRNDIELALENIGKVLSQTAYNNSYCNSHFYFVPEGIHNIEWRYILAEFLINLSKVDFSFNNLTESLWIRKIKNAIEESWSILPDDKNSYNSRLFSGSTTNKIIECLSNDNPENQIKLTTIHKVKGQTFDSVLLISAFTKGSSGGHWSHWLTGDEEQKRLGYVASSRPKKLLVWAIPEKDRDNFEKAFE